MARAEVLLAPEVPAAKSAERAVQLLERALLCDGDGAHQADCAKEEEEEATGGADAGGAPKGVEPGVEHSLRAQAQTALLRACITVGGDAHLKRALVCLLPKPCVAACRPGPWEKAAPRLRATSRSKERQPGPFVAPAALNAQRASLV